MLAGTITQRQLNAALKFGTAWRKWASLAGIPPHVLTQREPGLRKEPQASAWQKAKQAFYGASAELRRSGMGVWRLVELLVMDDEWPLQPLPALMVCKLREGLTRLADHYGLPEAS